MYNHSSKYSKHGYLPDGSLTRSDRDMCVILLNNVMVDLLLEPFPIEEKEKHSKICAIRNRN